MMPEILTTIRLIEAIRLLACRDAEGEWSLNEKFQQLVDVVGAVGHDRAVYFVAQLEMFIDLLDAVDEGKELVSEPSSISDNGEVESTKNRGAI